MYQQGKINEFNEINVLNFDELQKEKYTHAVTMREKKEKIIGAQNLVYKYIEKNKKNQEAEYTENIKEYRIKLTEKYGDLIMNEALDKIKKAKEEADKAVMNKGTGFKPVNQFIENKGPVGSMKLERGTNFVAKPQNQSTSGITTSLAKRGEGVINQSTQPHLDKPTTVLAKRGTAQPNLEVPKDAFKKPAEPEKKLEIARRGQDVKKEEAPKFFNKGFGDAKPEDVPKQINKAFGLSKQEEVPKMVSRGQGFAKPDASKLDSIKKDGNKPNVPVKLERAKK